MYSPAWFFLFICLLPLIVLCRRRTPAQQGTWLAKPTCTSGGSARRRQMQIWKPLAKSKQSIVLCTSHDLCFWLVAVRSPFSSFQPWRGRCVIHKRCRGPAIQSCLNCRHCSDERSYLYHVQRCTFWCFISFFGAIAHFGDQKIMCCMFAHSSLFPQQPVAMLFKLALGIFPFSF